MVLVSVMGTLPYGYQIQYPLMDFLTSKGVRLEGTGVSPDITATDPRFVRPGVR